MIITHQVLSIGVMLLSGLLIGATVDAFRLFWYKRKSTKLYPVHRLFELLIWIAWAIITFWLLYTIKGGNWRYLDPIAQIAGIFLYDKKAKSSFRFVGRILYHIFIRPLLWVGSIFVAIFISIINFLIKIVKFFYKILKK